MNQRLKPQLVMYRSNLDNLPEIQLPEGYTIRHAEKGEGKYWTDIINNAFGHSSNRTFEILLKDDCFSYNRVFYVCYKGKPVGTASAWHSQKWPDDTGYLHYVGVKKNHTGKKLGTYVSLAAMNYMKETKDKSCVLQTDDFRIPAIKTYLRMGFLPKLTHDNHFKRWKDIYEQNGWKIDFNKIID